MASENSELRGFLYGAFWGALIGTACGLVFAPQSGDVTRKEIKIKFKELSEIFGDLFSEASDVVENMGAKISSMTSGDNSVQQKIDQLKLEIENLKLSTKQP